MGLFDGSPSSADLSVLFDIPVLAVIDTSAMAQTFGAVALGLAGYRSGLRLSGVLANRVAGARHAEMLRESLPPSAGSFAFLPRDEDLALPERHLGLVQAAEVASLDERIDRAAAALSDAVGRLPEPVAFSPAEGGAPPRLLRGMRIAVARDAAFSFIYRANLDLLAAMGAETAFFSPLTDDAPPDCDALWLPGGYPELHLGRLAGNASMKAAIRAHHAAGKPILAECGGMLYLAESLRDVQGRAAEICELPTHDERSATWLDAAGDPMTDTAPVEVTRHIPAPPADVFGYFTDPALYVQWMGTEATLEPASGGTYRVRMADRMQNAGTFLQVSPPSLVVFTWGFADEEAAKHTLPQQDGASGGNPIPPGSPRVPVTLEDEDGGTRLTLRHDDLPNRELREGHRIAWNAYLLRLAIRAAGGDPGPDPHS